MFILHLNRVLANTTIIIHLKGVSLQHCTFGPFLVGSPKYFSYTLKNKHPIKNI